MRRVYALVLCLVLPILMASQVTSATLYTIRALSNDFGHAYAINNHGQIAGASSFGGVIWNSDGSVARASTAFNYVRDINDAGQAVGSLNPVGSTSYCAALWNPNGSVTPMGGITNQKFSWGYGINNSGKMTGLAYDTENHAALWSPNGAVRDIAYAGFGRAINNNGQVTGYKNAQAFIWSESGGFRYLGQGINHGFGINDFGQVVGDATFTSYRYNAFIWSSSEGVVNLGTLPSKDNSCAYGINNKGQVVGYSCNSSDQQQRAFFWSSSTGMIDLGTLPGDAYAIAYGINDAGQIVGTSINASGTLARAVVWNPVPEPSSIMVLVAGLGSIGSFALRRRK